MDGYFGPNDIMKKLQYAVKESNVDLYWGEVIELLGEALEALEAKDGQIAKLEADKVHLLGALEREEQIHAERTDELEAKILRIAELEEVGNHVVEWWMSEGMKLMNNAPYAMFRLRSALGDMHK